MKYVHLFPIIRPLKYNYKNTAIKWTCQVEMAFSKDNLIRYFLKGMKNENFKYTTLWAGTLVIANVWSKPWLSTAGWKQLRHNYEQRECVIC